MKTYVNIYVMQKVEQMDFQGRSHDEWEPTSDGHLATKGNDSTLCGKAVKSLVSDRKKQKVSRVMGAKKNCSLCVACENIYRKENHLPSVKREGRYA